MHLYNLVYKHTCKNGTKATIIFTSTNGDESNYKFESCDYKLPNNNNSSYSLKDWEDLNELSRVILDKQQTLDLPPVVFAK